MLSCNEESVICEVTLSMQRLVKKYGLKQHDAARESILDITSALQEYVEVGRCRFTLEVCYFTAQKISDFSRSLVYELRHSSSRSITCFLEFSLYF